MAQRLHLALVALLLCACLASAIADASTAPAPAPAPAAESSDLCAGDANCGNPVSIGWYQAHGWLLWLGFGVFMPVGIITSRHLQTITSLWFNIHIALMALATATIIAGCSIGFALFDAIPDTPSDDPAALHIRLGTAVFIMACLNFLLGLVRPHKGTAIRVIWYGFHFTLGTAAVLFAWYCIYTGMNLYEWAWVFDPASGASYSGGYSDLHGLKDWFTVSVCILGFAYLLLGRWDHMVGQGDAEAKVDGVSRFPSLAHVSSLLGMHAGAASEERAAAERKLEQERAEALA